MNKLKIILIIALSIFIASSSFAQGFLHAEGKNIVNGNGENVLLRGMGLGGWMLQEGYMLETSGFANAQHEIEEIIEDLIGAEAMEDFYNAWLENYCTKSDIDTMAAWGFNSIRLPMHYKLFTLSIEEEPISGEDTWLNKGFEMIDELLLLCAENEMYLILDLHAAPGGQGKDAAISDYDSTKPSLWESTENRRKTVALWKKLAERYADEPWIGGYDFINEPNWDVDNAGNQNGCNCNQNTAIWNLYKEIALAIRSVDQNHIVIIEGNCWGNRYNGLPDLSTIDDNLVMSFHKYWSYNNEGSINGILNESNIRNVPIWLGESGENSNTWFTNAINLVEDFNIGWAWWPYKKIGSVTGTVTIPRTEGYEKLLDYWENGGSRPSQEQATTWLMEQVEMLKLENCTIHNDVIDAMFRQAQGDRSSISFKPHTLPGTIFASDYDLGGNGFAYFDNDTANYQVSTDEYTAWNTGYAYRNDGVDMEACNDETTNGYNVGWTEEGEWLLYTLDVDSTAGYDLDIRYAANSSAGKFHIEMDGINISDIYSLESTGGWVDWGTYTVENIVLQKGTHQLKFYIDHSGFNLNYLKFYKQQELALIGPEIITLKTDLSGYFIEMISNLGFDSVYIPTVNNFELFVNDVENNLLSITFDSLQNNILLIELEEGMIRDDKIELSLISDQLLDPFQVAYSTFSKREVHNYAPIYIKLPSKIEAEDYNINNGFTTETCTDTGGGLNLAYANSGDYVDYQVYLEEAGNYKINYRVASSITGKFEMRLITDDQEIKLHQITVSTGGWQTWKTLSENASLPEGKFIIRLYVLSGEFNLNWFQVAKATAVNQFGLQKNAFVISCLNDNSLKLIQKSSTLENVQLNCYDIQGRKVFTEEVDFNGNISYLLSNRINSKGLFIFQMVSAEGIQIQKLKIK